MTDLTHRTVETNGIRMHLTERGTGPLVLLCHGFPESWYSWRHQLSALAEAGFHAVAPDCAAMVGPIAPRRSTNTRSFIWLATWSVCSTPWVRSKRSSPVTTGARRWHGMPGSCAPTAVAA